MLCPFVRRLRTPASFAALWFGSSAFGVRHKEHARSPVPGSDSSSFKIPNPDRVAVTLQVRTNVVSGKGQDSRNVLSDNPTRHNFGDQARKLRPQISVVAFPFLVSRQAEWQLLAGETAVNEFDRRRSCVFQHLLSEIPNILEYRDIRPMPAQNAPAKQLALAHGYCPYPSHFSG
jgi:hypothetical protein